MEHVIIYYIESKYSLQADNIGQLHVVLDMPLNCSVAPSAPHRLDAEGDRSIKFATQPIGPPIPIIFAPRTSLRI